MVTEIRNLSRLIWIIIPETTQLDHDNKIIHVKLLLAFVYACRHALLEEAGVFQDFENLLPMELKIMCSQESVGLPNQILYKVISLKEWVKKELEKYVNGLKMKGDLPVSLCKDFSKGFSALLTHYEGMLMIRSSP